jgi:flavin-dependent dehydrogenase
LKIAIAGAGLTGSYLYRLLAPQGHTVDLFDKGLETRCGISPCAWGTSKGFVDLVKKAGLDASTYILSRSDHVVIDSLRIRADLITFDKQRLIEDLRQGAEIQYSRPNAREYDRIVDCTGVARAFLPPAQDDIVLRCVQYRVRTTVPLENEIRLRGIGYSWCFPLSHNEYHIGCGSLILDPRQIIEELGWVGDGSSHMDVICGCSGKVRLTAPQYSHPYVARTQGYEVWGVGEAVGCVAPLAGDGIVPGMKSVGLLMKHWDEPAAYTKALLKEFGWMKAERRVIDKLRRKEGIGLRDAWTLKRNSRRMSMAVRLKQVAALIKHLQ